MTEHEKMTWDEIKRRYPDEYVVIIFFWRDGGAEQVEIADYH